MEYVAKAAQSKKDALAVIEDKIDRAEGIFFTDYSGLNVAQINDLRSRFFKAGDIELFVAKNTLTKIALKNKGLDVVEDGILAGPTAIALGYTDPVKPIKVIDDFVKEYKKIGKPEFKGGIIDGDFIPESQVTALKDLPPTDVLRAMVIGTIAAPLSQFVGVLNETLRSFVGVLDAIIEKKKTEEGGE